MISSGFGGGQSALSAILSVAGGSVATTTTTDELAAVPTTATMTIDKAAFDATLAEEASLAEIEDAARGDAEEIEKDEEVPASAENTSSEGAAIPPPNAAPTPITVETANAAGFVLSTASFESADVKATTTQTTTNAISRGGKASIAPPSPPTTQESAEPEVETSDRAEPQVIETAPKASARSPETSEKKVARAIDVANAITSAPIVESDNESDGASPIPATAQVEAAPRALTTEAPTTATTVAAPKASTAITSAPTASPMDAPTKTTTKVAPTNEPTISKKAEKPASTTKSAKKLDAAALPTIERTTTSPRHGIEPAAIAPPLPVRSSDAPVLRQQTSPNAPTMIDATMTALEGQATTIEAKTTAGAKKADATAFEAPITVPTASAQQVDPTFGLPVAQLVVGAPPVGLATMTAAKNMTLVSVPTKSLTEATEHGRNSGAVRAAEALGHKRALLGEASGQVVIPELGRVEVRARLQNEFGLGNAGRAGGHERVDVHVRSDDERAKHAIVQAAQEIRQHVQADVPNAAVHIDRSAAGHQSRGEMTSSSSRDEQNNRNDRNDRGENAADEQSTVRIRNANVKGGRARFVL